MRPIPRLRLLLLTLCAACATTPDPAPDAQPSAWIRLLEVEPAIGSRVGPETPIRVRAEYSVRPEHRGYRAVLMFATGTGSLRSAGSADVELTAPEGVIELSARQADVRGDVRQPLTAVIMIVGPPGRVTRVDTIAGSGGDLPPEIAARLQRLRDSTAQAGDSLPVRRVEASSPTAPLARSRRIFFNGAGPAAGVGGPSFFEEAVAEYRSLGGAKAFALAVDRESGRRTWGYGFGFSEPDSAIARALGECRNGVERRRLTATCDVFVNADSIPVGPIGR